MVGIYGASAALNPDMFQCGLEGVGILDRHCTGHMIDATAVSRPNARPSRGPETLIR